MSIKSEKQTKTESVAKSKRNKILITVLSVLLATLLFFGGFWISRLTLCEETRRADEVINLILDKGYVIDEKTGNLKTLTADDVAKLIAGGFLDKFSKYYTEEEYSALKKQSQGNYSGIGLNFGEGETLKVLSVVGNSPCFSAGILGGDEIVFGEKQGAERRYFTGISDFSAFLQDIAENTEFVLGVDRSGEFSEREFTVSKKNYKATYVFYQDKESDYVLSYDGDKIKGGKTAGGNASLKSDTAYIRIAEFEGDCVKQLKIALDYAKDTGKTKLVLDLRNNPGGDMDVLLGVCSMLVYNGKKSGTMVYSEGKDFVNEYKTEENKYYENIKHISVVANEKSASASECLIGAMISLGGETFGKDDLVIEKNADGIAKTYGKGIMQTIFKLSGGAALKITTAKVCWPNSERTCIHGKGAVAEGDNAVSVGLGVDRAIEILGTKN